MKFFSMIRTQCVKFFRKNMLFRMLVLYFTFICVIIYFSTAILMHYANKNLSEKVYISNLNSLQMMKVYCDSNVLQQINDIMLTMQLEINGKTKTHRFMNLKEKVTEKDIYEVYVELGSIAAESSLIESIEIYNRRNKVAVSSVSGVSYVEDTSYYESLFDDGHSLTWTQSDGRDMKVISTFPLHATSHEKNSCGIITINSKNLINMLKTQSGQDNNIEFFVTDENFNILISTADENFQVEFSQKTLPHEVSEIIVGNEKYQIFYVNSEGGKWKYFYVIPSILYENELSALRVVTFWNTFSMIVLSLLGLTLISVWLYKPIKEVVQALRKLKKEEAAVSDLDFINDEIYHLISQVDEVNDVITKNLPLIRSQLLTEVVYGTIEWDDFSERLVALEPDFEIKNPVPIVIFLSDELLNSIDVKRQDFLLYKICELLENIETDECKCIATKISSSSIAVLACFNEGQDKNSFVESVWRDVCELGICNLNLIVANEVDEPKNIGTALRKMLELRKYAFVYGWGNILMLSELVKREAKSGAESAEALVNKIEKLFASNDIDSVCGLLNSFYEACIQNEYSCDYIEKCFFSVMQVTDRIQSGTDGTEKKKITDDELSTMHGIYDYIIRVINNSCSAKSSAGANIEYELIENVKKYIRDNVCGDVSQINVARVFNVSAEHLSRTFKRVHGGKFSDFVTETKLEAAARMLCENKNMTIKKAAESVGYYNMNYFTMLFKKKYYMTPSQYKKANMSKETPKS